ncbi:DUF2063 domain-containing protein [Candidatus Methylacidiphilum fumarolicum]|uniref:Putative DNA-binding domain-containing protein n=2 Tax=Candidatus Methylacidiphilum fumarolicum TaxID=591154 RepID=I0JY50_METFB|nr:putative DNA-binding domain-containing protein [Candidatus Methylacidiphilum fumarolicum]MBW6415232.1 DNA-binding domain-containing protein [Candidatus Methylacidiphilum fumarolicum]TFE69804.1 hypothetical protein A7K73_05380 [Candidatus Methylacidiphilum fumarolicum]TFE71671.1 DUF2063 domain-containing protein [Candidatus Methylacidiphilum fumarolicum]TFE72623.1 DUF2063 domain-containing protein [Candidatus Methylacidiphilum fumarolicum]TFE76716.1 hypothetical protein A7D33_08755 [Candidat
MPINLQTLDAESPESLRKLQRLVLTLIRRPLNSKDRIRKMAEDGESIEALAQRIFEPSRTMTSLERLEVYNQQYWFKMLEAFYQDFSGLSYLIGKRRFRKLVEAYLGKYPPRSARLGDIGSELEAFLRENPDFLGATSQEAAVDMVRLERALFKAFDAPDYPSLSSKDIMEAKPEVLRIGLQPHISLLELQYAIEDFLLFGLEKSGIGTLEMGIVYRRKQPLKKPKRSFSLRRQKHWVVVHRFRNVPYIKPVEYQVFRFLSLLEKGHTLYEACEAFVTDNDKGEENFSELQLLQWAQEFTVLGWFCRYRENVP